MNVIELIEGRNQKKGLFVITSSPFLHEKISGWFPTFVGMTIKLKLRG